MEDVKGILQWVCNVTTILLVVAAGLLYAIGNVTDSSGAKGQAAMVACALGAIVAGGVSVFIGNASLDYGGGE